MKQAKSKDKEFLRMQPSSTRTAIVRRETARSTVIHNRELVCQPYITTVDEAADIFYINPGDNKLFSWLAAIGRRFEKYRFLSLKFIYVPSVGATTDGRVMLAVDFDPLDVDLDSVVPAYIANQGVFFDTPIWQEASVDVPKKYLTERYYVRDMDMPYTDSDTGVAMVTRANARVTDIGAMYYWAPKSTGAYMAGTIYVDYTVELFFPQMNKDVPFTWSAKGTGTMTPAKPFGTGAVQPESSPGVRLLDDGTNSIIHVAQPGTYQVWLDFGGGSITAINVAATYGIGAITYLGSTVINAAGSLATTCLELVTDLQDAVVVLSCAASTITAAKIAMTKARTDVLRPW